MLKGSIEYYKTKTFVSPKQFKDRTDQFFELQDSITSFINNKLQITGSDKDFIKRGLLFEMYRTYCNDNSQRCHPRSTLFKRLEDKHIRISKKDGYDVYRGITITTENNINDDDYEYGIDKTNKSVDIALECCNQINDIKHELENIKLIFSKEDFIDVIKQKPKRDKQNDNVYRPRGIRYADFPPRQNDQAKWPDHPRGRQQTRR